MIQFLADNIDQLDLALDQLAVKDRNFDRFALMLIDNVVELTLHKHVQFINNENNLWLKIDKPKIDKISIQKALGQYFDNKVKFALATDLITNEMCETMLNLHSFRNTSYHKGLRHESIMHSITFFYFITACELLMDFKPPCWSWSSKDLISHRARKYIGNGNLFDNAKNLFKNAFTRLKEVALSMKPNLTNDLYLDALDTIKSTDSRIQFLADDSPEKQTRNQVIINSQAWSFAFTDEAKRFAKLNGCTEKHVASYVSWIANNYKWAEMKDPISKWRSRINKFKNEKNFHKILKCYCDFIKQTEQIRLIIEEAARTLDMEIQHQIDCARGK